LLTRWSSGGCETPKPAAPADLAGGVEVLGRANRCSLGHVMRAIRFGFAGVIVVVLGRLGAAGRLPRNLLAGIRIPSTLRSDAAWLAGHQAAASALTAAGLGPVTVAIAVAATRPGRDAQTVLFRIGTGWLLALLGLATVQASRAARATDAS
jgi:hypothetical protein